MVGPKSACARRHRARIGSPPLAPSALSSPLESFANLIAAAHVQAEPQRLLFVFAVAELPRDASAAERARFEGGKGGTLAPVLCVDKRPPAVAPQFPTARFTRRFV